MNSLGWIAVTVMAFFAGYFVRGAAEQDQIMAVGQIEPAIGYVAPAVSNEAMGQHRASDSPAQRVTAAHITSLSSLASSSFSSVVASASAASRPRQDNVTGEQASASSAGEPPATATYPGEITDEAIDKLVPAPFNTQLKSTHGSLRENYQPFLQSDKQDPWDVKMQHKIADFMLGNAYSKFIAVDSIACRVHFCEIRVTESKRGSTALIIAEMSIQDWWDIGQSQFTMDDSTGVIATYGLLMKK